MTDCSVGLTLSPLSRKSLVVRNNGGAFTSDARVLLLHAAAYVWLEARPESALPATGAIAKRLWCPLGQASSADPGFPAGPIGAVALASEVPLHQGRLPSFQIVSRFTVRLRSSGGCQASLTKLNDT